MAGNFDSKAEETFLEAINIMTTSSSTDPTSGGESTASVWYWLNAHYFLGHLIYEPQGRYAEARDSLVKALRLYDGIKDEAFKMERSQWRGQVLKSLQRLKKHAVSRSATTQNAWF